MDYKKKLIDTQRRIEFISDISKSMLKGKELGDLELEDLDNSFLDDLDLVCSDIKILSDELEVIVNSIGIYVDDIFYEWNELDTIYNLYDKIKLGYNPDDINQFIKAVKPYHDETYNKDNDTIGYYGSDDRTHTENAIEWIEYYYDYIKGHDRRK